MFDNFLKEFGLEKKEASETNRRKCFLQEFSQSLGVSEDELIEAVNTRKSSKLMEATLQIEYGLQKKWINVDVIFDDDQIFFPVLFTVAAISSVYGVKIILICDDFNMSFIHCGHFAVVIEPFVILRDEIMFTLTGNGLLQSCLINDSSKFLGTLERLPAYCTINLSDLAVELHVNELDISESTEFTEEGERAPLNYDAYDDTDYIVQSLTIHEYMEKYSDNHGRPEKEAYKNSHRIDFTSSDYRVDQEEIVSFSRTIDIDGFFAVVEPKDMESCINCFGTMIEAIETTKTGTIESIVKIAKDANVSEFVKLRPVQIGFLDGRKQFELYACFTFDKSTSETSRRGLNVVELVNNAHQIAKTFPCDEECLFMKEHKSLACSNAVRLTQVMVRQYTRDYSKNSFKCLINHMNNSLEAKLDPLKGIKFFYFIRTIGTKNRYISGDSSKIHELLNEMLSCLNVPAFNCENGPIAYVDISLKFVPYHRSGTDKVSCLFIYSFKSNYLI